MCLKNIIKIANACINIGYWPNYFKTLTIIVILKPNKVSYDMLKSFRPIVLLNMLSKLIEKVIGDRFQFHVISNNFIYQSQLRGLKFKSTADAGIVLTHFIYMGWIKNLLTSTLTFYIAQFFSSLNYYLLTLILRKADFDFYVVKLFSNYLIGRKTQYFWNNFSSLFFNVNIGVDQGLALSLIPSALYLVPFLHILENSLKNLKILVSILSFVDSGLFVAQRKSFHFSNSLLFCSYNVVSNLLLKFELLVKYSKTKIFYFTRLHSAFNPPPLDLSSISDLILHPKES